METIRSKNYCNLAYFLEESDASFFSFRVIKLRFRSSSYILFRVIIEKISRINPFYSA